MECKLFIDLIFSEPLVEVKTIAGFALFKTKDIQNLDLADEQFQINSTLFFDFQGVNVFE